MKFIDFETVSATSTSTGPNIAPAPTKSNKCQHGKLFARWDVVDGKLTCRWVIE
jgi:hypothetical protein